MLRLASNLSFRSPKLLAGLVVAGLFFAAGAVALAVHMRSDPVETTHGPRLSEITPQMLSDATEKTEPAPVDANAAKTATLPKISTPVSVPATTGLGIAAGGGLAYLDQSDLDRYFNDLSALGVKWVRWDVDWNVVQPNSAAVYEWDSIDRVQATADRYSIQSLAILTYTPPWARSGACKGDPHCAPADVAAYGRFAGTAAARYKGRIDNWEVWNEPNFTFFWKPQPNVTAYAALLRQAYGEIKASNPNATVLSGGLAASGDEDDGSLSPITFMQGIYTQKSNTSLDAVSLHPYTFPAMPSYKAWWNRWQQIDPIRSLMVQNGDSGKKIWLTEFGAPTGGPGVGYTANQLNDFKYGKDYMQEAAQQTLMQEALQGYWDREAWMGPFFWYSLKDESQNTGDPENFFGLLRYDGSKKPAYTTFQNAIKQ